MHPSLGAPQVYPGEVAANRRRAIRLCAWTAAIPALLFGALLLVALSPIAGIAAFVVAGAGVHVRAWRLAPAVALRRIGAVLDRRAGRPAALQRDRGALRHLRPEHAVAARASTTMCPTPARWAATPRRSDLVVTTGLLRRLDPIELEGVIAHELAHVKRGDNGVSCVGITLGTLFGGEKTLRRCVGESREYRADVVGASAVRYPRGLLDALRVMMDAPAAGRGLALRLPVPFRVHPLGVDRPLGGTPRRPPGARGSRCDLGEGRRTEPVVRRGGPPS